MVNNSLGNPLVRAAVRTVLTGGALAATFVAHAQTSAQPASAQQTSSQQSNTQPQSSTPQLLAQATVPAPAAPTSSAAVQ